MVHMSHKKKRRIILGCLCGVLLLMIVGYAAFNTVLNIKGTSNINSNWDVKITGIEKVSSKGATDNEGSPSYENLSATFNTSFTTPGDYATYKIEITNNGSMDAVLKTITMPENTNNDILFYLNKNQSNTDIADVLKQNDTLFKKGGTGNVGYVYVTVLYKDYENQKTATAKSASMTITFDFEQADGNGGTTEDQTAAGMLIAKAVPEGTTNIDGLYTDEYEEGRYVYKGTNPNNYITFNEEEAGWRIISVETDGTLKIVKNDQLADERVFDSTGLRDNTSDGAGGTYCANGKFGCNAWAINDNFITSKYSGTVLKDAELNLYLNSETDTNSYYNTLSSEAKSLIQTHTWGIGPVIQQNEDLAAQIESENGIIWSGNIGLISASDAIRANSNTTKCGNMALKELGLTEQCQKTNYFMSTLGSYWTITPNNSVADATFYINVRILDDSMSGHTNTSAPSSRNKIGVRPALYLIPNITLEGEGTSDNPYTITKN